MARAPFTATIKHTHTIKEGSTKAFRMKEKEEGNTQQTLEKNEKRSKRKQKKLKL